jgi:nitrite reductase/ring-hydroxylating ferredoxin subunit
MSPNLLPVARLEDVPLETPTHAEADGIDLVIVRRDPDVHVFEGRCPHRRALLADGRLEGPNLICGLHGWDYRLDTGISAYNPSERIYTFTTLVEDGEILLDKEDLLAYETMRPARAVTSTYDRFFDDPHGDTAEEPFVSEIHALAANGLTGPHGTVAAMGVPRTDLPTWGDRAGAELRDQPWLGDPGAPGDADLTSSTLAPGGRRAGRRAARTGRAGSDPAPTTATRRCRAAGPRRARGTRGLPNPYRSPENQRVLLHRGRTRLRSLLAVNVS